MNKLLTFISLVALAGCSYSISGKYQCNDRDLPKIEFRSSKVVYVTIINDEIPGTYEVDKDKIAITLPHIGLVFTKEGDLLTTRASSNKITCKKV